MAGRYLIDGHNLIAHSPDIDLADPDDEVKLVYLLRSFATRLNKSITVVFDGGLPGGVSKSLSTSRVKVIFASDRKQTADEILIKLLRNAKNPTDLTLVSSDREVRSAAQQRRVPILTADAFLKLWNTPATPAPPEKDENPQLSAAEVEAWLKIFSQDEERP